MKQVMESLSRAEMHRRKHHASKTVGRPAKPSELLALQRRINRQYGHPYLMQDSK